MKLRTKHFVGNEQELSERLIKSISKFTGWDRDKILNGSEHKTVFWRKIACYVLMEKFHWTNQAVADLFDYDVSNAWTQHQWVKRKANNQETAFEVVPFINQLYHDLTL